MLVAAESKRRIAVVVLAVELPEIRTMVTDGLHGRARQAVVLFEMACVGGSPNRTNRRSDAQLLVTSVR